MGCVSRVLQGLRGGEGGGTEDSAELVYARLAVEEERMREGGPCKATPLFPE